MFSIVPQNCGNTGCHSQTLYTQPTHLYLYDAYPYDMHCWRIAFTSRRETRVSNQLNIHSLRTHHQNQYTYGIDLILIWFRCRRRRVSSRFEKTQIFHSQISWKRKFFNIYYLFYFKYYATHFVSIRCEAVNKRTNNI